MSNNEILKALKARRDITKFAKFLKMSVQGVYKLLKSDKPQSNQYYNFIKFILDEYTKEKKPRKSI